MNKIFSKELIKFLIVGGLGFVSNLFFVYIFTEYFGIWYLMSFALSALLTWTGMFFGNLFFTFSEESPIGYINKYLSFMAGYILLFLFNFGATFFLTSILGLHYLISISIGTIIVTALTFFYSKFFVYRNDISKEKKYFLLIFIFLSVAISFVNGLSHIVRIQSLSLENKEYNPYSLLEEYDSTNVIGPRIGEVLEGNLIPSDIDLYEYKDAPSFWSLLTPLFYAPFGLFTSSVTKTVIVADFIFPIILFALFFFLFYSIGKRKYLSLWFGTFTALYVYFAIQIPPPNFAGIRLIWDAVSPLSYNPHAYFLTRKESFMPALIPLILFFIFIFRSINSGKKSEHMFAGIFLALNAYMYPYHFIYAMASFGIFCVGLVVINIFKNFKDWSWLKLWVITIISAGVTLIPFAINQIKLRALPQYGEILSRFGIELGRNFRVEHWQRYLFFLFLSTLVLFLARYKTERRLIAVFIASTLLAGIAVLNMQVILGFSVQSDHWLNRDLLWGITIAYFVLFVWGYDYIKNHLSPRWFLTMSGILLLCCIYINSVRYQYALAKEDYSSRTIPQSLTEAFNWLNKNTNAGDVIVTPSLVTNYFLPLYTHNKIFVPRALNSVAPESEILERLFITYRFFGIKEGYLKEIFNREEKEMATFDSYEKAGLTYFFAFKYLSKDLNTYTGSLNDNKVPQEDFDRIINNFKSYTCEKCFNKFRSDYVFIGPQESRIIDMNSSFFANLKQVYNSNSVTIYKIANHDFAL